MNKKIFIAAGIYPPESGGPATYVKLLEGHLPARGFEVVVLPYRAVRHVPKMFRHAAYFVKCLRIGRGADIIYAQDTASVGLPAALAAMVLRIKFIVRVPGDYAWEQARQRFDVLDELDEFQTKKYSARVERLRRIQKFVVARATAVVVPSNYMKKVVQGWTDAKKLHVIYSSIETPVTTQLQRPEGFLVVTAARRVPWKGIEGLERVVAREDGWTLFVADNLPRAEALGWIQAADVFALNSTYEGLSHVLVEAMTLGTPVVATRVGGNPELIDDGVTGLLIPPKDDEALHKALKNIHDDRGAAQERAFKARERAKEFSIEKTIGTLAALLQSL